MTRQLIAAMKRVVQPSSGGLQHVLPLQQSKLKFSGGQACGLISEPPIAQWRIGWEALIALQALSNLLA